MNWGIIGLGRIAHKFASDLRHVPNAKLHAVAASDGQRAKAFAQQYNAPYSFGSYEEMLNCPHLDVVYNATTNEKHCATTLQFLRRRIPVLCEKPLALNTHEVQLMWDTARQNNTFLMEALWSNFLPAYQKIQELIAAGAIGRPLSIKADFGGNFPFSPHSRIFDLKQGGGSLLDIGIYCINLAVKMLGKPTEMNVMGSFNPQTGSDDSCMLQFRHDNGAISLLNASVVCKLPIEAWIFGEKGYIQIPNGFYCPREIVVAAYTETIEPTKEVFKFEYEGWGYHFEAEHVQNCLKNNQLHSPVMTPQYSLDLMQLMDSVREKIGLSYATDIRS